MRKLDAFPFTPTLHINSHFGFQTAFGGIISILLGIVTVLASAAFSVDVFTKTNPIVLSSDNVIQHPTIDKTLFKVFAAPTLPGGVPILELEKYLNFRIQMSDSDGLDKTRNMTTFFTYFNLDKCQDSPVLQDSELNLNNSLNAPLDNYYCLSGEDSRLLDLYGSFGSNKFVMWKLIVETCQNSTLNNYSCKTPDQIKSKLGRFFIHFGLSTMYVDSNDYDNPLKRNFFTRIMRVSVFNYRNDIIFNRIVDYTTDSGFLLESKSTKHGILISRLESDSLFNEKLGPILDIMLTLDNIKQNYNRSYIKIQTVAANIGGMIKFLTVILSFINSKWGEIMFLKYLNTKLQTNVSKTSITVSANNYLNNRNHNVLPLNQAKNSSPPTIKEADVDAKANLKILHKSFSLGETLQYLCSFSSTRSMNNSISSVSNYYREATSIEVLMKMNSEMENAITSKSIYRDTNS